MILIYALVAFTAVSAILAVALVLLGYGPGGRRESNRDTPIGLHDDTPIWLHDDFAFDQMGVKPAEALNRFFQDLERLDMSLPEELTPRVA